MALSAAAAEKTAPAGFTAIWLMGSPPVTDVYVKVSAHKYDKFQAGSAQRGPFFLAEGNGKPVTFYNRVVLPPTVEGGPAKETYVSVGEIAWPAEDTKCALLIMVAIQESSRPLKLLGVSLDDDVARFKPENLRIYNLFNQDLAIKLDTYVTVIPAGKIVTNPYPVKVISEELGIANFTIDLGNQSGRIISHNVRAYQHSRILYLIYGSNFQGGNDMATQILMDFPKVPASTANP
jgi:hypothetical protein